MSLKGFHILFISVSVLLAVGTGIWGVQSHAEGNNGFHLSLGLGSFAAAAALIVYGIWFLRKIKDPKFK